MKKRKAEYWYHKNRKYKHNLRRYVVLASIRALCISCISSFVLVTLGTYVFYRGPITARIHMIDSLLICVLAVIHGSIMIYSQARKITDPIMLLSETVNEITAENFEAKVPIDKSRRGKFAYEDEVDELCENVNHMAGKLGNLDYMRKDFMSNVSHEVKTPVAAITGFTEILLEGNLSEEEQREYLKFVNQQSVWLSKLCENMLKLSRMDHEESVPIEDEIRVDEQLRKCIILLAEKWEEKEIDFVLELQPVVVRTNENLLQQVWMNLLDNAIKYSDAYSQVKVTVQPGKDEVKVLIQDNGIGIEAEKLDRIFERFYQCEESHKKQGCGLGLPIVKRILDLVHGEIKYESQFGQGTLVTVSLMARRI